MSFRRLFQRYADPAYVIDSEDGCRYSVVMKVRNGEIYVPRLEPENIAMVHKALCEFDVDEHNEHVRSVAERYRPSRGNGRSTSDMWEVFSFGQWLRFTEDNDREEDEGAVCPF